MHHDNQHDDFHAYGQRDGYLLSMLRYAMGVTADTPLPTTADQWQQLFDDARRHSLLSVIYQGVSRVAQSATSLPLPLLLRWAGDAESIAQLNREFNAEAARLTQRLTGGQTPCEVPTRKNSRKFCAFGFFVGSQGDRPRVLS